MSTSDEPRGPDLSRIAVREPPPPKAKRFFREVSVAEVDGRHRILLDRRPVKTPLQRFLETPVLKLAHAVASEWDAQKVEIDPVAMPLTRLVSTALDRVAAERAAMSAALLAYVETDLLCYRATSPSSLKARQQAQWQPILDWLATDHRVALNVTEGIVPVTQPQSAVDAAEAAVARLSVDQFTALQAAVGAMGSFALGLALVHGRISAADAIAASYLDETFQNEQWGEDAEAMERRRRISSEVESIGRYLGLIG